MQIKLLVARATATGSENRGDVIEVEDVEAIRMIEAEQAEPVRQAVPEKAVHVRKSEKATK
jgi:hypothetical protein